jgi:hypothetical protein
MTDANCSRIPSLGRTIVHIKVGEALQDFGVHRDFICHHSVYFKATFNSGFEETQTGTMKFPETNVHVFELFYNWLYTQKLRAEKSQREE